MPEPTVQLFASVPSTNDTILDAGGRGEAEGTLHIALAQTAGRGRGDHRWWSPPGAGLWMSFLLRPRAPRERWVELGLVTGLAVRLALEDLGVRGVELEWPNDLVVGRRKLGGLLAEVRGAGRSAWVAMGVGVNLDFTRPGVARSMPAELRELAICATEAGPPRTRDPEAVAREILTAFWPLYERFHDGERPPSLLGSALAHAGREVEVHLPDGTKMEGTIAGLGPSGELLVLRREGGVATIVAGDVIYR